MENLMYMVMGGISMMMVIYVVMNFDLVEVVIISWVMSLSFNMGVIGIIPLIIMLSMLISFAKNEKFLELVEAFSIKSELNYLFKKGCKTIVSVV